MARRKQTKQSVKHAPLKDYDYVIGVDPSYSCTGIAAANRLGDIVWTESVNLDTLEVPKPHKRHLLYKALENLISTLQQTSLQQVSICIIYERVRLISNGSINEDYIKSMSGMIATIEDIAWLNDLDCYSVDTRSWKSQVVGTSKPLENDEYVDPKKYPTIVYVRDKLGIDVEIRSYLPKKHTKRKFLKDIDNNRDFRYNDNVADAICIALYGFKPKRLLQDALDYEGKENS